MFSRADREAPRAAYAALVEQARAPTFYQELGVPDTVDGRFDMIVLHLFLLLARLKGEGAEAEAFGRAVTEVMVADMDENLRELGVGDLSVPKRIGEMVGGLNGRIAAYGRGLAAAEPRPLEVALENNLYGTVMEVDPAARAAMASYMRREAAALAAQPLNALLSGRVVFGTPPEPPR